MSAPLHRRQQQVLQAGVVLRGEARSSARLVRALLRLLIFELEVFVDEALARHPLQGTRWVTAAGARDPHPDRDGIAGMKRAAAWLQAQGATVLDRIEDPDEGHGALQRNPQNVRRVLDLFLGEKP